MIACEPIESTTTITTTTTTTTPTTETSDNNSNSNNNIDDRMVDEENKEERETENIQTKAMQVPDVNPSTSTTTITATDDKKATKKLSSASKTKPSIEVLALRRQLQLCCKTNDLHLAMQLYQNEPQKAVFEAQSYYNLLNLCDGLPPRGVHIGTPKHTNTHSHEHQQSSSTPSLTPTPTPTTTTDILPVSDAKRQEYALTLKQDMEARKLALNETAYTALIRIHSKSRQFDEAHALLDRAEQTQQVKPRLRLYSGLLIAHCDVGHLKEAIILWNRLHQQQQSQMPMVVSEREYAAILSCAIHSKDTKVVERVLSDLAEDVLVPSHYTVECVKTWFRQQTEITTVPTSVLDDDILFPTDAPNMGPVVGTTEHSTWSMDVTTVVDGVLQTGCLALMSLKPVPLSDTAWNDMLLANEAIVLDNTNTTDNNNSINPCTFQGGGKGRKRKRDIDRASQQWKEFQKVLELSIKTKIDVVIDGANVGYYKQNFENAPKHVDYKQIDSMVQYFREQGKTVLLVLHERHFSRHLLPVWAEPIVRKWNQSKVLYEAPSGMNDDWFWLHAALWSGRSTLVVTNDEMRDHHFQMLSPRSFLRWKERHQVHFTFRARNGGGHRHVQLVYPPKYSRRIQRVADGLVIPLTKRGDENRFLDGVHVADGNEPEEETYLCIRPNS